ncbi:MAG: secondary thiamine-phosphate synthase enzyme YjbQ, partial [Candidatus Bathyarchaeia archaeon]
MFRLDVITKRKVEFIDITDGVRQVVSREGVEDGVCYLFVPHTTAGITINENADPSVVQDITT